MNMIGNNIWTKNTLIVEKAKSDGVSRLIALPITMCNIVTIMVKNATIYPKSEPNNIIQSFLLAALAF